MRTVGRTLRLWRQWLLFLAVILVASPAMAQVALPRTDPSELIEAGAPVGNHWMLGDTQVWWLRGGCHLRQGTANVAAQEAVLWIRRSDSTEQPAKTVTAYLEGNVTVDLPGSNAKLTDNFYMGTFSTRADVHVRAGQEEGQPDPMPPIYQRAAAFRTGVSPSPIFTPQYTAPVPAGPPPDKRRLRIYPRSEVPFHAQWASDPTGAQSIIVIDSGVNLQVEGLNMAAGKSGGKGFADLIDALDVTADRMVIWTAGVREGDLGGATSQSHDTPLEIYMEGNVVFRQGSREIHAERMYYNVRTHQGTVLHADMLTPVPSRGFDGKVRLQADVLHAIDQNHFFAEEGFFTASRLGEPSYRLQSQNIQFEAIEEPATARFTGQPLYDPKTNEPLIRKEDLVTARNSVLFIEGVPCFYWPVMSMDLNDPEYYIRRLQYKSDNVFGSQIFTDFNMYQVLGMRDRPAGTDWDASIDYFSGRGLALGTGYTYQGNSLFGVGGRYAGMVDFWGIQDHGIDNLGPFRDPLTPETDNRYRLVERHREELPFDLQLSVELGATSDRNFMEQYFKREWDEFKDESTDVELKQTRSNWSWSVTGSANLDPFFNETEWLPRLDHFWVGQDLIHNTFSWYEHSQVGYGRFNPAQAPQLPLVEPLFTLLPWERSAASGIRAVSRQEIDWPFQLGPLKLVPYALGELAHWDQDLDQQPIDRAYGQVGIRSSLPFWAVDPTVRSDLFNVNGIAHKVVIEADFSYAQTNVHMNEIGPGGTPEALLPLYDALDDAAIDAFRRRFLFTTFGNPNGPTPVAGSLLTQFQQFDERYYALRAGLADSVTSPVAEIADDMTAVRLDMMQRWQTKRGPEDSPHIIDWITLDTSVVVFPDPNRDDFGQTFGLAQYDFRWHVGDRTTVVSSGLYDFFTDGQHLFNLGVFLNRPPRGSIYLGFSSFEGPASSDQITLSYSYWMSPKWVSTFGTSVDVSQNRNVGENFTLTRVGESFLISANFNVNTITGVSGVGFIVEPRFMPKGKLGGGGGAKIPVAGAYGLE